MSLKHSFPAPTGVPALSNGAPLGRVNGRPVLIFDQTTAWTVDFPDVVPQGGYSGTVTVVIKGFCAAATGGVAFDLSVEALTHGVDTVDMDAAESFDAVNTGSVTSVAGTAGYPFEISFTLSNVDAWAAGDSVRFRLTRNVTHTNDTAAGAMYVTEVEIRDAA